MVLFHKRVGSVSKTRNVLTVIFDTDPTRFWNRPYPFLKQIRVCLTDATVVWNSFYSFLKQTLRVFETDPTRFWNRPHPFLKQTRVCLTEPTVFWNRTYSVLKQTQQLFETDPTRFLKQGLHLLKLQLPLGVFPTRWGNLWTIGSSFSLKSRSSIFRTSGPCFLKKLTTFFVENRTQSSFV